MHTHALSRLKNAKTARTTFQRFSGAYRRILETKPPIILSDRLRAARSRRKIRRHGHHRKQTARIRETARKNLGEEGSGREATVEAGSTRDGGDGRLLAPPPSRLYPSSAAAKYTRNAGMRRGRERAGRRRGEESTSAVGSASTLTNSRPCLSLSLVIILAGRVS